MRTVRPTDGMKITESVCFEPGVYLLPNGIQIAADGISIEGTGAHFVGNAKEGHGISFLGLKGVRLTGLSLSNYYHGIHAEHCHDCTISNCVINQTAEVAANTIFLDIWLPADKAYGGGVCLVECKDCTIEKNDLQHQMNGILTYGCTNLRVMNNLCNYSARATLHSKGTLVIIAAGLSPAKAACTTGTWGRTRRVFSR